MYIDKIMTSKVISVSEDTHINEMIELMHKNQLQHLPVINNTEEIIGIVSHQDIQKAAPSAITTLSVGESNYLLAKITAQQIMQNKVVSCKPTTLIEEAAQILREHSISSLPVVSDNKLIGIVTMEDILDFFLDLTGCRQTDATRIAVKISDKKGSLSQFMDAVNELGGYISTIVSPTELDDEGKRVCIIRYYADNPHLLDQQLKQSGIEILTENFLAEQYSQNTPLAIDNATNNKLNARQQLAMRVCKNDPVAKMMNVQFEQCADNNFLLKMKVQPKLLNGAGLLHGAVTFALADIAIAIASNSHNRIALSIDSNIKYLQTCKVGDSIIATTTEISLGKTIANYQVEIRRSSDNALTALFTGTVLRKKDKLIA
ncbi:MAG: CBS domain-containing protein [Pseudomonadota bacterium]